MLQERRINKPTIQGRLDLPTKKIVGRISNNICLVLTGKRKLSGSDSSVTLLADPIEGSNSYALD